MRAPQPAPPMPAASAAFGCGAAGRESSSLGLQLSRTPISDRGHGRGGPCERLLSYPPQSGMEMVTVVPSPSMLSSSRLPWCMATISSATASPIPDPLTSWFAL